ncbi:hypothetical protein CHLRE_17g730575v5 [Chlamydomonas reinhardtii]|uniref:Uncharacterized protein n=1 Tax=Chlamydomonas reinhardtii TaxID=3055 RepID=A0A2K3CQY5_CHLRE|nr:uncharacterized protein CHLRE_17g730575v5 [Chlamydomonas reinhardtii]PNW70691.1 hypothetical protein CHLRE_17g730575v5 [Chlamydomonas reinhardtii]
MQDAFTCWKNAAGLPSGHMTLLESVSTRLMAGGVAGKPLSPGCKSLEDIFSEFETELLAALVYMTQRYDGTAGASGAAAAAAAAC